MERIFVCQADEIPNGGTRVLSIGDKEIALIRHADRYFAYRNVCPHQGGPACEGTMMPQVVDQIGEGGVYLGQTYDESDMHIVCPWHGYEFHLSDGSHVCDSRLRLEKFQVIQEGDRVYVEA